MFGRRPDATLVKELSTMRRFMPYVSPRRNDSVFYLPQEMEVEAALEFLEKLNRDRPSERPISLFHLLLRSISCSSAPETTNTGIEISIFVRSRPADSRPRSSDGSVTSRK